MDNMNLTRDEAITWVGLEAVEEVEAENCEPTSRLQDEWDNTIEYKASIVCTDKDGYKVVLDAMYYPSKDEFLASTHFPNADEGELLEDLSYIDWQIDHYRVQ